MYEWIYVILLSLYLEMLKYIRNLKINPCKSGFENVLLVRSRDRTVTVWSARSLL